MTGADSPQVLGASVAQAYSRLIVFGDSLSDNGDQFRLTGGVSPANPPYVDGRASNGPVWVEQLGFSNLQGYGTTTGNVDNAFGGARTAANAGTLASLSGDWLMFG